MKQYAFRGVVSLMWSLFALGSMCRADLILEFSGRAFSDVQGTAFSASASQVVGRFVFDSVGSTAAKSFSLSAISNENLLFAFDVPNTANPPVGITVGTNSFTSWNGSLPGAWDVTVFGNVAGSPQEEQISIHWQLGDLAARDLLSTDASVGVTNLPGSLQVVPEPTGGVALISLGALAFYRRRYNG